MRRSHSKKTENTTCYSWSQTFNNITQSDVLMGRFVFGMSADIQNHIILLIYELTEGELYKCV